MVLFFTYDTGFALCWASASIVWPVVWWAVWAFRSNCVLIRASLSSRTVFACHDTSNYVIYQWRCCTRVNMILRYYDATPSVSHTHRIRIHRRATRVGAFEVFEAAHVALRTLLAFSQPVNCIFWPIGMLNWLVAASKLHKHSYDVIDCCCSDCATGFTRLFVS